ncbi:MAG: hypothetical protein ABFE01_04735, partial [Phycisphaerales bacterium]
GTRFEKKTSDAPQPATANPAVSICPPTVRKISCALLGYIRVLAKRKRKMMFVFVDGEGI